MTKTAEMKSVLRLGWDGLVLYEEQTLNSSQQVYHVCKKYFQVRHALIIAKLSRLDDGGCYLRSLDGQSTYLMGTWQNRIKWIQKTYTTMGTLKQKKSTFPRITCMAKTLDIIFPKVANEYTYLA